MFHIQIPNILACIRLDFLCPLQELNNIALTTFEIPSDNDGESDDYGDANFFDEWSNTDNWSEDGEENDDRIDKANDKYS
jgi:hypothetical protein